ncbi:hypothetical protein CLV42_117144 [Chitinophaga ginsengisoli]|uniref:Uncharacterized protein n=1 Tax=Chitinophaga ginsengisoli TaxID=363837 RepID=A0A2P8FPX8_9BACT|nr:hypothetical protein CLV42_117144 [Chitinophaga ginsengisoli]
MIRYLIDNTAKMKKRTFYNNAGIKDSLVLIMGLRCSHNQVQIHVDCPEHLPALTLSWW